ncbi:MAG TPA: alpha/beta hydrolase [Burkholderiaceae bacterium]|nr:alpha/beta hydrolase [Burkholderiaceae bacterium]
MKLGELYAYTGGKAFDAAKPSVLFIHGAQNDHSVWILQSRWCANHGYNTLAIDLPGHGQSAGPLCTSVELMADAAAAALDTAGLEHVHVVGHSMGSLIALELAGRLKRARSLTLVGTALPMRVSDALLAATREAPLKAMDMINAWSFSGAWGGFSHKPQAPGPGFATPWGSLQLMHRIHIKNGAEVLPTDFAACNAYAPPPALLQDIDCPALVVAGSADQMTPPKAGRAVAAALPAARLVVLEGAGHQSMSEAPDELLKALAAHLQSAA